MKRSSLQGACRNRCSQRYVRQQRERGRYPSIRTGAGSLTATVRAELVFPKGGTPHPPRSRRCCPRSTTKYGLSTSRKSGIGLVAPLASPSSLPFPSTDRSRDGRISQQQRQQTARPSAISRGARPGLDRPVNPRGGPRDGRVGCRSRRGPAADTRRHFTAPCRRPLGQRWCLGRRARDHCRSTIPIIGRTRSSIPGLRACSTKAAL